MHGEEEAKKAKEGARALFSGQNTADMPTVEVGTDDLRDGTVDILGLLVKSSLAASRAEARRNVEQGGVSVNGEKVADARKSFTLEEIAAGDFVLRRGKKKFCKIIVKS